MPQDRHHLKDVDIHFRRFDKAKPVARLAVHVLELDVLWLHQRIQQVEHVELNAFAVDLCEDVTDLLDTDLLIELNVGNLILVQNVGDFIFERRGILDMRHCERSFFIVRSVLSARLPELLVFFGPTEQGFTPTTENRQREHVPLEKCGLILHH